MDMVATTTVTPPVHHRNLATPILTRTVIPLKLPRMAAVLKLNVCHMVTLIVVTYSTTFYVTRGTAVTQK